MLASFTRILFAILLAMAVLAIGQTFATASYGFDHTLSVNSFPRIALLALSVFLGIFAQVVTTRLKKSKSDQISIITEIRASTKSKDFWIAMLASPLVMAAAYESIAQLNSLSLAFVIGFQNGFFFHAILSPGKRT